MIGPEFILSIKPHLENTWTDEHESAWMNVLAYKLLHTTGNVKRMIIHGIRGRLKVVRPDMMEPKISPRVKADNY